MSRKHSSLAVINLGRECSQVLVYQDNQILFDRSIDIGGNTFDEIISKQLEVSLIEAKMLREKYCHSDAHDDLAMEIHNSLRDVGVMLVREIALCLRCFDATVCDGRSRYAVLTGDECEQLWLQDLLKYQTDLCFRIVDSFNCDKYLK